MYIYNVTLKLEWSIHNDWMEWMKEIHIPEVMDTGCFNRFSFARLLETDETDGPTYTIQFFCLTKQDYDTYIEKHAPQLRRATHEKWGDHLVGFRSIMQVVN